MSIRFVPSGRLGKQCGICEYYLYVHGIIWRCRKSNLCGSSGYAGGRIRRYVPDRSGAGNLPEDLSVSSIYAQYDSYAGMCCRILSVYVLGRIGNHVSVPSGIPVLGLVLRKPVIRLNELFIENWKIQN